jgi:hypothetical protein
VGVLALLLLCTSSATARIIALDPGRKIDDPRSGWLPYAFATDSLGTTIGAGAFTTGHFRQPQVSMFGTAFGASNESWGVVSALNNFRMPGTERLFVDSFLFLGHFTESRFYADLDRDPSQTKAGSNDSDPDDYVTGISNDAQFEVRLNYPLPIGNARDDPLAIYRVNRGLLESGPVGGETWNPMISGRTTTSLRFFGRYQDLDEETQSDLLVAKTNGLEIRLE